MRPVAGVRARHIVELGQERIGKAAGDDVAQRAAHRWEEFFGVMRFDECVVADRCRGQRPVTARGAQALARGTVLAYLDEIFERLREQDGGNLRKQRISGLVMLTSPWRELGLGNCHGSLLTVMARSCNVQRNSDRAIARHDADLS
jgi:hypothetical protein